MRILATLFVTVMTLSACSNHGTDSMNTGDATRTAVGVNSKAGKALAAKDLCTDIKVDALTNKVRVNSIRFNGNSTFFKRNLILDDQMHFMLESSSRGYWGLVNNVLMLKEKNIESRVELLQVDGGAGKVCFQVDKGEAAVTYCPCDID